MYKYDTYIPPPQRTPFHYDSFPITRRTLYPSKTDVKGEGRKKERKKIQSKDRRPETSRGVYFACISNGRDPDQVLAPPDRGSSRIAHVYSTICKLACDVKLSKQHSHRGECPKHFVNHKYNQRDLPLTHCLLFNRALAVPATLEYRADII